ncbi:MAG: PEP/pyruvate-binding domain-containing protein [Candidatus Sulfobium sp.]
MGHLKSLLGLSRKLHGGSLPFTEVFRRFRDVLDNNNRALEIITDMGEKLGGDYLFDVNYIRDAYSRLSGVVAGAVHNFDILTRGRYGQLPKVFERIDSRVTGMIYDVASVSGERVFFYEDISWDMAREVGGKNSALAEMMNYLKLNVPGAFAITTHAFDEFMEHNRLNAVVEELRHGGPDEAKLARIRDLIMQAEIPAGLDADIDAALEKMKERCGGPCFLAVRSSGEEEDGEFSFAGQFETVLNVTPEGEELKAAYRKVLASLFSAKAAAYQRRLGYEPGKMKMAVGCVVMVDAVSSGVVYSSSPDGDRGTLIVNATWGLGESIVEGRTDSDFYRVRKGAEPEILSEQAGSKQFMIVNRTGGGTERIATPADRAGRPCLTPEQVKELAGVAMLIEKHFRKPQDIEWAIDSGGRIFILQARPLRIQEEATARTVHAPRPERPGPVLIKDRGVVVQKGTGGGTVFIVRNPGELEHFPKGSVLVAKHDSSDFVRVMPFVSAIITDTGTPTSHMSSLCREFRVPTIVNAGDATVTLKQGQKVTVHATGEGSVEVYEGINRDLIEHEERVSMKMEDVYEYRKKRFVLRYISPLNLVDPLLDDFVPERCKTIHDILRFMHEKSVAELVDSARYGTSMLKKQAAIKLDLPIPAGIIVIDIGGGLSVPPGREKATLEQITSVPLRAIVKGMMHPGVWHSHAVSLKVNDFLSSMMRMSDITAGDNEYVGYNVAVASGEYMNLSLRFGYHFNMIDCYCSENTRNNHLYFRFVGGATDIVKRSRRIELLAAILREYGFNIKSKGDLIIARLANISREELAGLLDQTGRLIAFTRQLDAVLNDDSDVELYSRNFIEGNYEF